jgi:hypothetical protein
MQDGGNTKSSLANTLFAGAALAMIAVLNQGRYRVQQLIREVEGGDPQQPAQAA